MKILVINNHSVLNLGDYAILRQALTLLHRSFPHAELVLVFNDPESARTVLPGYRIHAAPWSWIRYQDAQRHVIKVAYLRRIAYLVAILWAGLLGRWCRRVVPTFVDPRKQALYADLATADLVVACGGGYLMGGLSPFALAPYWWSALLKRPLVLLPQSVGPFYDLLQTQLVRIMLQHTTLPIMREAISARRVADLGLTHCAQEPDLVLGMASAPSPLAEAVLARLLIDAPPANLRVGVTALDWQQQNRQFRGQAAYEQALLALIDHLTARGAVVVLFAQSCGPIAAEDDRLVNQRLRRQARDPERVVCCDEVLAPDLLQAVYGLMDYFVATRLHSFIFATNADVPALAIGYLSKSQGVLAELGLLDRCLSIEQISAAALLTAFAQLEAEGQRVQGRDLAVQQAAAQARLQARLHQLVDD